MSKKGKKNEESIQGSQMDSQTNLEATENQMGTSGAGAGSGGSSGAADQKTATTQLETRIQELTGDLQRLQAEFINYKRREGEARAETMDMAKRHVLLDLLPLLDNIDRALSHRPEELKDNSWAGGVEAVSKQASDILAKLNVKKIESVGQPFDHELHEAVGMEEGDGEREVVTEELQPGYMVGDKVLRHAMVKVGRQ